MKHLKLLTAALSLSATPILADAVTIGTVQSYDVVNYTVDPSALKGFEKALGDELCQRAGHICVWKVMTGDKLWDALLSGEVDVVMDGVSMAQNVGEGVDRTMPFLKPDPYIHVGLPATQWPVEGAVVAHLPDPAVTAFAKTSGATFSEYQSLEAALSALHEGKVLSLFGERAALIPVVEASEGKLAVVAGKEEISVKPGIAMALRANDIDLRFSFEDQIFEMSQDGSLSDLTEKWFGGDAAGW